jgi:DNA-binding winged helix-turn-helix (wHTH) protein
MALSTISRAVVRFDVFEVDLLAAELKKHGRKLKLQDQPFRVLAMLLEHPREVVTRDQMRQKLWPADTFVDFEHGLNSAVARLRETLNDSADRPRFVETLPRRGYRFIATVETTRTEPHDAEVIHAPRKTRMPWLWQVVPAVAVGLLFTLVSWRLTRNP